MGAWPNCDLHILNNFPDSDYSDSFFFFFNDLTHRKDQDEGPWVRLHVCVRVSVFFLNTPTETVGLMSRMQLHFSMIGIVF